MGLPLSSWRRLTSLASVVGQTSGQWVKPKKIAYGLPASLALGNGWPLASVSVNGPPTFTASREYGSACEPGGRNTNQPAPTRASATNTHKSKRTFLTFRAANDCRGRRL